MLPVLSTVNLVVPEVEAVIRSEVVAPVLFTIRVALFPASPEISRSPLGLTCVPRPTLPVILLRNSDCIFAGLKDMSPVVDPPKVRDCLLVVARLPAAVRNAPPVIPVPAEIEAVGVPVPVMLSTANFADAVV